MESFKEYCEGWIGLNRWQDDEGKFHSTPMERQEYFKTNCQDSDIKKSYEQHIKVCKELIEIGAMV